MHKTLHRSQTDKIIAGVCGGLAEYFSVDSTIIRLLFILIIAMGGSGLLIYIILWLIMPKGQKEPAVITEEAIKEFTNEVKEKAQEFKEEMISHQAAKKTCQSGGLFGWILVILGVVFLANNLMPFWMRSHMLNYWPMLLILIGAVIIVGRRHDV